jgi:UDP-2,4-diacetamido-2,4,6-trideoxy-beta-L-altropyranose hydrolase
VDASVSIGTGHVMRCLTLASALRVKGFDCFFICCNHSGNLISEITKRDFSVTIVPSFAETQVNSGVKEFIVDGENKISHINIDCLNDAIQTANSFVGKKIDCLVVDHYGLDVYWERCMRSLCRKLVVIDDLMDREHICDIFLDQNLGRKPNDYKKFLPKGCRILLGPKYSLLRPEFIDLRTGIQIREGSSDVRKILISMGGVDEINATSKVLRSILQASLSENINITVVMGKFAPWIDNVKAVIKNMPQHVELRVNVNNMAELMANADLAIGAAGTTSWERCCLGLPSIICILAENQISIASALERVGAARIFKIDDAEADIGQLIRELLIDSQALMVMRRVALGIVDGHGVHRVVNTIEDLLSS